MNVKNCWNFFCDIIVNHRLILELTKKDFQTRYLGSYLGMLWAFIQPMITILIFWFVFEVGFKSKPVNNFPFILWLASGLFPWFFFSDSISSGTTSIVDNSYLVKKILFRVSILPVIKITSALIIHCFFILILILMFIGYGFKPTIYQLQVFYYLLAAVCLELGIAWITSSIIIFLKDVGQLVSMVLQFGFWVTPIFWSFQIVPPKYQLILKLNPVYYIIEGYRNSFIYHKWFWENWELTIYFWVVTFITIIIGLLTFKRLRPHFADVL